MKTPSASRRDQQRLIKLDLNPTNALIGMPTLGRRLCSCARSMYIVCYSCLGEGALARINFRDPSQNLKVSNKVYTSELSGLQAELVKLQQWIRKQGLKPVVVFEGHAATQLRAYGV